MSVWNRKKLSFGFVSTRFAGTDGVSLETQKWVEVLKTKGCDVYYMAGKLDTDPETSVCVGNVVVRALCWRKVHNVCAALFL